MNQEFIHLHLHTAYSICLGAVKTGKLAKKAKELGFAAVAMTDANSLSGAPSFTGDLGAEGVQPIVGLEIMLAHPKASGEVVLLAKDREGFANIVALTSESYLATQDGVDPKVSMEDLERHGAGIILLTGGYRGPANEAIRKGRIDDAGAILADFVRIFGDRAYAEVVRHGYKNEKEHERQLVALADQAGMPLVATNDVFFLEKAGHAAQDALMCIGGGTYILNENRRRTSRQAWLKPASEMRQLFRDLPEACDNSVEIAKRCAAAFEKAKPMLPPYPGLEGQTEEEAMRLRAKEGLDARLAPLGLDAAKRREYDERLDYELGVISQMGFPGYFLIVSDFIGWAKDNGIAVGPGRGSGAGSIVAWSLRITDLDPIEYKLLFERFLNPERVSMPDFDIDFCQDRRDEVIGYVKTRYGADKVAQIGTIGKLKARAAVRDAGRVLQVPYGAVNFMAGQIVDTPTAPKSLKEAMAEPGLAEKIGQADFNVKQMFDVALGVEGLYRAFSTHAAGIVISDRPLQESVPLMRDKTGMVVTQYDMKGVEAAGLVKFDFLGLKTLDVIEGAKGLLAEQEIEVDFEKIGTADEETYELLASADTFGIFQLESAGMQRAIRQVKPTALSDIIALNALYRPGPMENIPVYAAVKNGERRPEYLHPSMAEVLSDTNGIIVYQEQVMRLAQLLAGMSLGGADLLRRAMGKKIKEEMDALKPVFIDGCMAGWWMVPDGNGGTVKMHGNEEIGEGEDKVKVRDAAKQLGAELVPGTAIPEHVAAAIFDLIQKFADYGFNRSHAAAYGLIGYQTAYLKAHHPHEFFASAMNYDMAKAETLGTFAQEMRLAGIEFRAPDINKSRTRFSVEIDADGRKAVRWALSGIRGVGQEAMDLVIGERRKNGPYETFHDFVRRTAGEKLNKKGYENLIFAGALDGLHRNRAEMLAGLPQALAVANDDARTKKAGQSSMFDLMAAPSDAEKLPNRPEMPMLELLQNEFKVLGMFVSGHPIDQVESRLRRVDNRATIANIDDEEWSPERPGKANVGALLLDHRFRQTKSGKMMAILSLSDASGMKEALMFNDDVERLGGQLEKGATYLFSCNIDAERDEKGEMTGGRRIIVKGLQRIDLTKKSVNQAA